MEAKESFCSRQSSLFRLGILERSLDGSLYLWEDLVLGKPYKSLGPFGITEHSGGWWDLFHAFDINI